MREAGGCTQREATGRALVVPGTVTARGLPAMAGSGDSVTSLGVITPVPAAAARRARASAARRARAGEGLCGSGCPPHIFMDSAPAGAAAAASASASSAARAACAMARGRG
jgi:hypothetical protein